MKKYCFFIILILIISFFSCSCSSNSKGNKTNILKVGILGPYTGPSSQNGEEFRGAAEIAFENIDYRIGDYKVELVWMDSQSDPQAAAEAYEKAVINDKIDAAMLNWHSSVAVIGMEMAAKYKIPHFFGFGASDVVNEKYHSDPERYSYWMGKTWPAPEKLVGPYIETLNKAIEQGIWKPRNKRAAIYGGNNDWGRDFGKNITKKLKEAGWNIVGEKYFSLGEVNFKNTIENFKDLDVSLIAGTTTSAPAFASLINEVKKVDLNSMIIADGLGWIGNWYELTGNNSDYVLDMIPQWTSEKADEFIEEYKEKYQKKPSASCGGLAYDQSCFFIKIANETLNKYGELTSETLYKYGQEALWTGKTNFTDGIVMKEYIYTNESVPDPVVKEGYFIFPVIQYFDGQTTIIWPESQKTGEIIVP
jgi:branched-chain amino acid transport system substrate-binding protein